MSRWTTALAFTVALAACLGPVPSPSVQPASDPGFPAPNAACSDGLPPAEAPVYAFFTCADDDAAPPWETHPVPRPAQAADPLSRLEAALIGLLGGPTEAEAAAGYTSVFSGQTAGALSDVHLAPDGTAVVDFADFRRFLGTASTSTGSELFLSQLNATVFQIDEVNAVDYRIEGSCRLFWEWLQRTCAIVPRP